MAGSVAVNDRSVAARHSRRPEGGGNLHSASSEGGSDERARRPRRRSAASWTVAVRNGSRRPTTGASWCSWTAGVPEASATYLPSMRPDEDPVHLNYDSRRVEFRAPPLTTPTYFEADDRAEQPLRRAVPARRLPVDELRGRGRRRHRSSHAQRRPRRRVGAPGRPRLRTTSACTTSARPARDRCCGSRVRTATARSGPVWCPGVDIRESMLRTYINGAVVQEGPIAEMTFPIDYILADLCRHITLLPGDVILTGTANSRPMQLDDVVEVEVTGVGRLTNTVAECPRPATRWGTRRSRTPRASCGWPTAVTGGPSGTPRAAAQAAVDAVPSPS